MVKTQNNSVKIHAARHPVVVVLGHIDHGKTTLLDYIRKTSVVAKEAGGITQHLGAYEIQWKENKITFLDTPGHETFSKMRERGAKVADIGILVIAADDGVKPQTKEAYEAIKKAGIPFVVALNKIDKNTADVDRVKGQLAEMDILVEGWGGSVPVVGISAKEGRNVDELLDTVLLLAELEELKGDSDVLASGVVIEAHLDSRRGPSAMLLITQGTLRKGQFILADDAFAPVRILEDSAGQSIDEAGISTPVEVVGFSKVPTVGVEFHTFEKKSELEKNLKTPKTAPKKEKEEETILGIMVKADTVGSYEALSDELRRLVPDEVAVKFFDGGVGDVTEGDIKTLAAAKKAIVVGLHTKIKAGVTDLAERSGVEVKTFTIIYEAIDWVEEELKKHVPKKMIREDLGKLVVLKTFSASHAGRVIGGRVKEGRVPKDASFDVLRAGEKVFAGHIIGLQRNKQAAQEVKQGEECGLLVQAPRAIEERDILACYYEREA